MLAAISSRYDTGFSTQIHAFGPHCIWRSTLLLSVFQGFVVEGLSETGTVCHGIALEVGLDGVRQGQLVNVVDVGVGHDVVTTQLVETQHFVGPPQPLHPIPLESHPRQFLKALSYVEVDQRRDLKTKL